MKKSPSLYLFFESDQDVQVVNVFQRLNSYTLTVTRKYKSKDLEIFSEIQYEFDHIAKLSPHAETVLQVFPKKTVLKASKIIMDEIRMNNRFCYSCMSVIERKIAVYFKNGDVEFVNYISCHKCRKKINYFIWRLMQ